MNDQTKTPSTFEDRDEFDRKLIAENLIKLLTKQDIQISPMLIDGQWGAGKTEFCRKMINLLEETHPKAKVAYIDAFKADHANEPLITLIAEISKLIDVGKKGDFIRKAIPLIRHRLKILGKASITWLLIENGFGLIADLWKALREGAKYRTDIAIEQILKDHANIETILSDLRGALEKIAEDGPLYLFIDELDRCRPDFAISMLENIKHVFDVPNVHFILIANLKQLKDSINHCYGTGVDAQKYLDKFIRYSLPLPTDMPFCKTSAAVRHAEGLIEKSALLEKDKFSPKNLSFRFIETLIKKNELSLREVEALVRHLEIYQFLTCWKWFEDRHLGVNLFMLIGVYIYCFEKDISGNLISWKIDTLAITGTFGIQSFVYADGFGNSPSPEEAIALLLMLDNPDGVEGAPHDGIDRYDRSDLIKTYHPNEYKYMDCENCVDVIANTVRILRMDDTSHRDRVLKNLSSSSHLGPKFTE